MPRSSRSRLLRIISVDYRPNAWRRRDGMEDLLSEVSRFVSAFWGGSK